MIGVHGLAQDVATGGSSRMNFTGVKGEALAQLMELQQVTEVFSASGADNNFALYTGQGGVRFRFSCWK